jgi:hypothetical protein
MSELMPNDHHQDLGNDSGSEEIPPKSASELKLKGPFFFLDLEFNGETAAKDTSYRILKYLLKTEAKSVVLMSRFLKDSDNPHDQDFDNLREAVPYIAQRWANYPPARDLGEEKQHEIKRFCFSTYISYFLKSSRGDQQTDHCFRRQAWKLLSKDAQALLNKNGQTLDLTWLYQTMRPLILQNNDPKSIGDQLALFATGHPNIIQEKPTVSIE